MDFLRRFTYQKYVLMMLGLSIGASIYLGILCFTIYPAPWYNTILTAFALINCLYMVALSYILYRGKNGSI